MSDFPFELIVFLVGGIVWLVNKLLEYSQAVRRKSLEEQRRRERSERVELPPATPKRPPPRPPVRTAVRAVVPPPPPEPPVVPLPPPSRQAPAPPRPRAPRRRRLDPRTLREAVVLSVILAPPPALRHSPRSRRPNRIE